MGHLLSRAANLSISETVMRSIPDIPETFQRFPAGYVNDVRGWAFDRKTVAENKGKLLTLDMDFGSTCTLNCPSCFRKNNTVDQLSDRSLDFDGLKRIVLQAKPLGLRSVKFLGAGDPFENFRFLEFLRFLHEHEITPLIFTKGHVLGDDLLVTRYFSYLGIRTGEALAEALDRCGASIMLGFNSFNDEVQAKLVGAPVSYVQARNRALHLLVDRGLARTNPTRIALAVNPITKQNVGEAFDIYAWGRRRGFYVIVTPTMISGRARKQATWVAITPPEEQLVDLYTRIYEFNIRTGLQTLDQIDEEGISAYAGGHPCNQVATGLYVTLGGTVLSCPGDVSVEGNVWEHDLKTIWMRSQNFKRRGVFNNGCIAKDGKSIPEKLYGRVMQNLRQLCLTT
jgi:MoaA/NifB/PqqE/SkfB family radical SAM enzyme